MTNSSAYAIPGIERETTSAKLSTLTEISESICEKFNTNIVEITTRTRRRNVVLPRQIGMALSKLKTKHTLDAIGIYWGGYNHTTVLHAVKTIKNFLDTNRQFREQAGCLFIGVTWPHFKN